MHSFRAAASPRFAPLSWSLVLALGCTGDIGETTQNAPIDVPPDIVGDGEVALVDGRLPPRVWRLSPLQYQNVASDFLGIHVDATIREPPRLHGLSSNAQSGNFGRAEVTELAQAARSYAAAARADAANVSGCGADFGSDACIAAFVEERLAVAFRRDLSADEQMEWVALFDEYRAMSDYETAFEYLVQTTLMSSEFLYRSELGVGESEVLEGHEIASLLSFMLTDRGPDEELLDDVANLRDPEVRAAHARRLMADSEGLWTRFFQQWLGTEDEQIFISAQIHDTSPALVDQMIRERDEFIRQTVVIGNGSLRDVFTSTQTWAEGDLAEAAYGIRGDADMARRQLNGDVRAGVLTQSAWLTSHSSADDHVVKRGMNIFIHQFCKDFGPPPDIDLTAAVDEIAGEGATVAEVVEARGNDRSCGRCHHAADPAGLVFERFDHLGAERDTYEDGAAIESLGFVPDIGSFDAVPALTAALVEADELQRCFVRRVSQFAIGADLGDPSTSEWLDAGYRRIDEGDQGLAEFMVDLVSHPAFIERKDAEQ